MEFEQILKRLDWLDEEHRKDKSAIDTLLQRASNLEGDLKAANKIIKELNTQISQLSTTPARIEQFDSALALQRSEFVKYIDDLEIKRQEQLPELEKRIKTQYDSVNKSIADLRKIKEPIDDIKRQLEAHADEQIRNRKLTTEWEMHMRAMVKTVEDAQRAQKASEELRREKRSVYRQHPPDRDPSQ
jgi:chromosome segregation ATPase